MSVSRDFLSKLDELMMFSDEPCLCSSASSCRRCVAAEELENLYMRIDSAVEKIKDIQQSIS